MVDFGFSNIDWNLTIKRFEESTYNIINSYSFAGYRECILVPETKFVKTRQKYQHDPNVEVVCYEEIIYMSGVGKEYNEVLYNIKQLKKYNSPSSNSIDKQNSRVALLVSLRKWYCATSRKTCSGFVSQFMPLTHFAVKQQKQK